MTHRVNHHGMKNVALTTIVRIFIIDWLNLINHCQKNPKNGTHEGSNFNVSWWSFSQRQVGLPLLACFCMVAANTELLVSAGLVSHLRAILVTW